MSTVFSYYFFVMQAFPIGSDVNGSILLKFSVFFVS